jgi:hypothetical protein
VCVRRSRHVARVTYHGCAAAAAAEGGKGLYICYSLQAILFSDRADITERRFRLLRNVPSRAPPPPTPRASTK